MRILGSDSLGRLGTLELGLGRRCRIKVVPREVIPLVLETRGFCFGQWALMYWTTLFTLAVVSGREGRQIND
jgi:hypothetical protein